jgi:hypothetical protein
MQVTMRVTYCWNHRRHKPRKAAARGRAAVLRAIVATGAWVPPTGIVTGAHMKRARSRRHACDGPIVMPAGRRCA